MCETVRTDLVRPSDSDVEQEAVTLQAQLLQFRFENYRKVEPGPVPGDEILRPRSRDLLQVLSAAHLQDVERCQRLLEFFDSGKAVPLEPLSPEQNAVLRVLYSIIHVPKDYDSIQTNDLTKMVNYSLRSAGETLRLLPRKVGAVLTSLGFSNRTRTNAGWFLSLNREDGEKLHQLAEHYGIERLNDRFQMISLDDCDLCRTAATKKSNRVSQVANGQVSTTLDFRNALEPQRS